MLTFGAEAGPVRNKAELKKLFEIITERMQRLYGDHRGDGHGDVPDPDRWRAPAGEADAPDGLAVFENDVLVWRDERRATCEWVITSEETIWSLRDNFRPSTGLAQHP